MPPSALARHVISFLIQSPSTVNATSVNFRTVPAVSARHQQAEVREDQLDLLAADLRRLFAADLRDLFAADLRRRLAADLRRPLAVDAYSLQIFDVYLQ